MSDSEDEESSVCPLCVEEMDLSDKNFLPCPCGYRVCMWCWHHIRENLNGLCPACRTPYNSDPHAFSAVDRQEIVKKNRERKQREKQDKKVSDKPTSATPKPTSLDRKHLHNYRVVQRNLVYVIGLPLSASNEDLLRKAEYFGQYGKIVKVVVHRNQSISQSTVSAYVTFAFKEDAKAAIHALDNYVLEGHILRASFGTTKYCNNFIRNVSCNNPDCVYLHELGDEDDRFTKEEIQAGHTKLIPTPGKDQSIVTGCGGPSGTGKRPVGEPTLPPPVFIQDNPPVSNIQPPKTSVKVSNQAASSTLLVESEDLVQITTPVLKVGPIGPNLKSDQNRKVSAGEAPEPKVSESSMEKPSSATSVAVPSASVQIDPKKAQDSKIEYPKDAILSPESSNSFNGVTWNAVFPVPTSSLSSPIWSAILRISHSNLQINPFRLSKLPVSDILELTLPPVDAVANMPWPKPHGYYSSSMQIGDIGRGETSVAKPSNSPPIGSAEYFSDGPKGTESVNSFTALRQLFPGVNLSYGSVQSYAGSGIR